MIMKMKNKRYIKKVKIICVLCIAALVSGGCVDQHPKEKNSGKTTINSTNIDAMLEITDQEEKAAVEAARAKVAAMNTEPRIIATSPAAADICDKLELDLVGVCKSSVSTIPKRYKKVKKIGTAMSPDMEIVASLSPDWILSPSSLQTDLQPKYEEIHTEWAFLNLKSVTGMYRSIQELGVIFGKEDKAQELVDEFTKFYKDYQKRNQEKTHPKVLVLMGLPGSYVIATPNSYVGESCGTCRRRKCLFGHGRRVFDSKYGGYEEKRTGRNFACSSCSAGSSCQNV